MADGQVGQQQAAVGEQVAWAGRRVGSDEQAARSDEQAGSWEERSTDQAGRHVGMPDCVSSECEIRLGEMIIKGI